MHAPSERLLFMEYLMKAVKAVYLAVAGGAANVLNAEDNMISWTSGKGRVSAFMPIR
jgi:hypothetical protein